jgi:hypothetical protein
VTSIARICERWTLQSDAPQWPSSEHLTNSWLALCSLLSVYGPDDITTVHELHPGVGAQELMVRELFDPILHVPGDADLVTVDAPHATAWLTRPQHPYRALLDHVFWHDPKAVVVTDTAGKHFLHDAPNGPFRQQFASIMGPESASNYLAYLQALVARHERLYGYVLVRGYFAPHSAVLALVPGELKERVPGRLHPTPAHPVGLELF